MEENNFSTFIKELRMEKGLSQEELAKALYVHRTTVNKWENDNVIPLNDKLLLIADYFDISVDELLNGKRSDINTASSTRNNTIVELIKSKTKSQKLLIYSVLVTLILILGFLTYYFISNQNFFDVFKFNFQYKYHHQNKNAYFYGNFSSQSSLWPSEYTQYFFLSSLEYQHFMPPFSLSFFSKQSRHVT